MSDEPDQKFISEPAPRERVPPGLPGPPPRRPRAGERGGAGPGQRGGGGEAPAAREVPGFRADFCVPGRLRHRPRARAGRRGRGRGAAGSPGVLTESTGPDFPAAVAAVSLRHPSPPGRRGPQGSRGRRSRSGSRPLGARPPAEPREARGGGLWRREGAAPTRFSTLGLCSKRGSLGPGLGPSGSPPSRPRRRASRFPREEKKFGTVAASPASFHPGRPLDSPHCTIPAVELPRDSDGAQKCFPGCLRRERSGWVSRSDPRRPLNSISPGDWVALYQAELALFRERTAH